MTTTLQSTGATKTVNMLNDGLSLISPELVGLNNLLFRRTGPWPIAFNGIDFSLRLCRRRDGSGHTYKMTLLSKVPMAEISVSDALLNFLLGSMGVEAGSVTSQAMLVEFAGIECIEALERILGTDLRLVDGATCADLPIAATVSLRSRQSTTFEFGLKLSIEAAERLINATPSETTTLGSDKPSLPFLVRVVCGATVLSVGELSGVRVGEIILTDERPSSDAFAVIAEHLLIPLRRHSQYFELLGPSRRLTPVDQIWANTPDVKRNGRVNTLEPIFENLDDIPVHVHFEIGREEMTLHRIRGLTEGEILPVAPLAEDAVRIVANGRIIGRGVVMRIGEGLGVLVTRLSHDE